MSIVIQSSKEWKPQKIKLEAVANEVVLSKGNVLVAAGPGAGKTELLAQRACYLLQTNTCVYPKKILAVSFKKDSASNLEKRVIERCGKEFSTRFESMTFDSFSKELLDRFILALPTKYRPDPNYIMDKDNNLLKLAYNIAGYSNVKINTKEPRPQIPKRVWEIMLYGEEKNNFKPALTFSMISILAKFLLQQNSMLVKALQETYSHVFLDEFQDTTALQYELVKTCFKDSSVIITAVGDQKQRIMLWAGALQNVFDLFINDFYAIEKTMIMNHRSAPKLIALQKVIYKELDMSPIDIIANDKWKSDDGKAEIHFFENQINESIYIKSVIKSFIEEGISPREICILVKRSPEQYAASLMGKIEDIDCSIRNEVIYQDILKEDISKLIIAALYCSIKSDKPDLYSYIQETDLFLNSIDPDDVEKVNKQIERLDVFLANIQESLLSINSNSEEAFWEFDKIITRIINYLGSISIKNSFPQYQNGDFLDEIINKIKRLLWDDYLQSLNWEKALNSFEGETSVPVMTIHKSKGLEFEVVIFLGLEDNAFFSFSSQRQEDLCAFFVAISRAKSNLIITMSKQRDTLNRNSGTQSCDNIGTLYLLLKESGIVDFINES